MKEKRLVRKDFMCVYLLHFAGKWKKQETLPGDTCKEIMTAGKTIRLLVRKIKTHY